MLIIFAALIVFFWWIWWILNAILLVDLTMTLLMMVMTEWLIWNSNKVLLQLLNLLQLICWFLFSCFWLPNKQFHLSYMHSFTLKWSPFFFSFNFIKLLSSDIDTNNFMSVTMFLKVQIMTKFWAELREMDWNMFLCFSN